jgi:hypothetical protein
MDNKGMYQTKCAGGCGKTVWAYAKNKLGELPKVYCLDKLCKSRAVDAKRFK